jgi:hypothetical protein
MTFVIIVNRKNGSFLKIFPKRRVVASETRKKLEEMYQFRGRLIKNIRFPLTRLGLRLLAFIRVYCLGLPGAVQPILEYFL